MYLSCDPGVANFGMAVIDPEKEFKVMATRLVKTARKFTDDEKAIEAMYGARTVKVFSILREIEDMCVTHPSIDTIVVEAPFYNALTPVAYASLLEVITAVRYLVVIKKKLKFKAIEPLLVKKFFTRNHMATKQFMKEFLTKRIEDKSVILADTIIPENLSEHEIDSVAVGYSHYLSLIGQV